MVIYRGNDVAIRRERLSQPGHCCNAAAGSVRQDNQRMPGGSSRQRSLLGGPPGVEDAHSPFRLATSRRRGIPDRRGQRAVLRSSPTAARGVFIGGKGEANRVHSLGWLGTRDRGNG